MSIKGNAITADHIQQLNTNKKNTCSNDPYSPYLQVFFEVIFFT